MTEQQGGCHCGRIAFAFEGEVGAVLECNCSFCAKRGALLQFVPQGAFRLKTPRDGMSTYKFNKHHIAHHFCPACGISPFSEAENPAGELMMAVNMRCVEGVDPRVLDVNFHNGRDL